jgi:hypothetical protein
MFCTLGMVLVARLRVGLKQMRSIDQSPISYFVVIGAVTYSDHVSGQGPVLLI